MWPTTIMAVLFAGGMLSLVAELGVRSLGSAWRYAAGLVGTASIVISLAVLGDGWSTAPGQVLLQPVASPYASLYVVDPYTSLVALTVLAVGLAVSVVSLVYSRPSERSGPFFALLLILLCSLVGVISAGDLLTLFLFWEGMSVSAYGLVSFGRSQLSLEATLKYFLAAGVGSLLALYGIGLLYASTGTLQISVATVEAFTGPVFGQLGLALLLLGLGVEAAIVPLNTWLPDVYAASSIPASSAVAGAVTGTGVFALLKIVEPLAFQAPLPPVLFGVSGVQVLLISIALITMVVGNLSALAQSDLRRMLSFSSIAQTGYMLAALSTFTLAGVVAVVFTIWNHGLVKANFFMVIGKGRSGDSSLDSLRGTGRQNRYVGFLYGSSSLAMMGAPPFGMFWSEILIVQSLIYASSPVFFVLAAAVVLNIVMSIGYYYRVINTVVFGDAPASQEARPFSELIPPASLLALSVFTGLLPFLVLGLVT
jgi:formate hydrogenlyase subunit 3/multisubunit Na+/H+ antiporter MnhD subunit